MNRNPSDLFGRSFDLAIVGAGIHGAAAAWGAARAGLRVALLERADFGGAASANSLKTIHGGFRYLQHGNLRRMRESIRCRRRFMTWAPPLVRAQPFLVPTWGGGLRGAPLMRIALAVNDVVAADRNRGLDPAARLGPGRILSRAELSAFVPGALPAHWTGGALWYDALASDTERLTLSFVLDAAARGAACANYAEVLELRPRAGGGFAIAFRDVLGGRTGELDCRAVVNASGTSFDALARRSARRWIRAWNLVVARRWFGEAGVGLESARDHVDPDALIQRGKRNFFFAPWRDGTINGTVNREDPAPQPDPALSAAEIDETIADINAVFPAAELRRGDVTMTHVGLLPGHPDPRQRDEVDKHSEIIDAAAEGGPAGLFSIKGVKYTTGLDVGLRAARRAAAHLGRAWGDPAEERCPEAYLATPSTAHAVQAEGAVRLADLIFRRTGAGSFRAPAEAQLQAWADEMGALLGWAPGRRAAEVDDVRAAYRRLGVSPG